MSDDRKYAKSISKFPQASVLGNDDLILISKKTTEGYSTQKTNLSALVDFSTDGILSSVDNKWNLGNVNVSNLQSDVASILSSDGSTTTKINSKLSFETHIPEINVPDQIFNDNSIITKTEALNLITNSESFIGNDSYIDCNPNNCNPVGRTNDDSNLMIFRIPTNGNDSSEFIYDGKTNPEGSVICEKTGNLVVYGWLADRGNVLPQEAWVALCGKIKNYGSDETKWTILQVQPWITSDRSHIIQYVGFNIPVNQGLELKIRCGFKVDDTASNTNDFNTLTFEHVQPNTFVGYIVQ